MKSRVETKQCRHSLSSGMYLPPALQNALGLEWAPQWVECFLLTLVHLFKNVAASAEVSCGKTLLISSGMCLCHSQASWGEEGIKQRSSHPKSVNPSSGLTAVGLHSCFTATLSKLVKVAVAASLACEELWFPTVLSYWRDSPTYHPLGSPPFCSTGEFTPGDQLLSFLWSLF